MEKLLASKYRISKMFRILREGPKSGVTCKASQFHAGFHFRVITVPLQNFANINSITELKGYLFGHHVGHSSDKERWAKVEKPLSLFLKLHSIELKLLCSSCSDCGSQRPS